MHEKHTQTGVSTPIESDNDFTPTPIDWRTVGRVALWLVSLTAWALWIAFLVIPTMEGLHDTTRYPLESNILFILTGLVFCIAGAVAYRCEHRVRLVLFTLPLFLLAGWF